MHARAGSGTGTVLWMVALALIGSAPVTHRAVAAQSGPPDVSDLPLVVLPAARSSGLMALVMSGDGNWASFVAGVATSLTDRSVPVVGLESRAYLRRRRSPAELTRDMERVLRRYLAEWGAERVLIVGYSRGADFAPFVANLLPADLRERLDGVILLSPTKMASFEFHLADLVRYSPRPTDVPLAPQVAALADDVPVLCVYGVEDRAALCPALQEGEATVVPLDGGHHLNDPAGKVLLIFDMLETGAVSGRVR